MKILDWRFFYCEDCFKSFKQSYPLTIGVGLRVEKSLGQSVKESYLLRFACSNCQKPVCDVDDINAFGQKLYELTPVKPS